MPSHYTVHQVFYYFCRLRAARVLLIGMKGLGAEIAKNIVLAGIKSLTLLDSTEVCIIFIRELFICIKILRIFVYMRVTL